MRMFASGSRAHSGMYAHMFGKRERNMLTNMFFSDQMRFPPSQCFNVVDDFLIHRLENSNKIKILHAITENMSTHTHIRTTQESVVNLTEGNCRKGQCELMARVPYMK